MKIIKRNGEFVEFDKNKIIRAINKAILDIDTPNQINIKDIENIANSIEQIVNSNDISLTVENIQDEVVKKLMDLDKDLAMKYQSYRTVREGKRTFEKLYEEKIGQLLGKDKTIMNENANKDSKTISVQRDLLAGISSKNYYLNNILPKELKEAHEKGEIHIHDLDYLLFKETNCLGRETEFVTSNGVKSFKDFDNGDKIIVLTPYGNWKPATVKSYGEKQLYKITFKKNGKIQTVRATDNHRWLLKDGSITTSLKVGDYLLNPKSNFDNACKSDNIGNEWKVISIEEDSFENVWCLEVEDDKSFVLKNGITTGNCELVDLARMLKGGCKIGNAKMLEPNSVDVAVGHTVQIIASVSSNTYGGCTIPYIDMTLVPYVRKTFMKHFFNGYKFLYGTEVNKEEFLHDVAINYFASDTIWEGVYDYLMREYNKVFNYAIDLTDESVKQAMQGLEYEINSLSTVNGQTPFTTIGFGTETSWEAKLVQKHILKTRLSGFGAKKEVAIFPKLVFTIADGINFKEEDPNWDIAQIAFECMTKSIYPDILFVTKEQCENKTVVYPMG